MLKLLWLLTLLCLLLNDAIHAQRPKPVKNTFMDSTQLKDDPSYDLPVIIVNENERSETNIPFVPGLLYANRDVFMATAGFHFSVTRFRMRGYDGNLFSTQVNGMHMNNLDDGNTQWGLWTGLNDVTRNMQMILGLRPGEQAFGNIGNQVNMDMRASKQWMQTQAGYTFSNRNFRHRFSYTKSTGFTKQGWAFSLSASWRAASEGFIPGTHYSGGSYYIGIDKKLTDEHVVSILFFGSAVINGKQGPVLKESLTLHKEPYYNPYWGYLSGKKRNANEARAHQPVLIITDEQRVNNTTTLTTTIGMLMGEKSSTAMDWYKARDPRSDYYRYLPSYQADTVLRAQLSEAIKENNDLQQIDWDHLYDVNRHSRETLFDANGIKGNSFTGLRSHYILEERVAAMKRLAINSVFNTRLNDLLTFSGGISLQLQQTHYFKRMHDLLGGEYFVDWNQFAERDFPADASVMQNDLRYPNRIVRKGDLYGYDYLVHTSKTAAWMQMTCSRKKTEFFAAAEISNTNYLREGRMKNGLFPFHSFGKSAMNDFTNYGVKAGFTYKINGRKYLYFNTALFTKAPLFDNVFISPRTRNTRQENTRNEKIATVETGYVWNAPKIKLRLSAYATDFRDGMNVMTFYHDGYGNFVNYALSGINKFHFGVELGIEYKLSNHITCNLASSVARYYYTSRQFVTVTADNDAYILEKAIIYSKNFRVGGTPQEAHGLGVSYQSSSSFYYNLFANYFTRQWLDFNPLRRTYAALEGVTTGSDQWNSIINQTMLPEQFTMDLLAGGSTRVKLFHAKQKQTIVFNVSINNLLNKQDLISGGYEQLRFDTDTKDINKFPPKYFYAMGLNFSVSCYLRM